VTLTEADSTLPCPTSGVHRSTRASLAARTRPRTTHRSTRNAARPLAPSHENRVYDNMQSEIVVLFRSVSLVRIIDYEECLASVVAFPLSVQSLIP
jgi:hypothetical protein